MTQSLLCTILVIFVNLIFSQSAGSQRWMRSSPGYCHGETSDALKMPDSGNHRKHSTVSGNLPKYRSGYGGK